MDRQAERPRPKQREIFPSCRGCGKKAEGETFNLQGGLVACCEECGSKAPMGFNRWTRTETPKR